ncbi:MMPL family transporter [Dactylosporangium sp. NBC_01737]|uniref:MMPL family transporter n=1 Tax=Dactylosporangium sp. NBC_01737 TaxID=2975959 RepID=UPI002E10AD26|nr:MMPL family transporter [Dactylosporangium sp. NBC_01737]
MGVARGSARLVSGRWTKWIVLAVWIAVFAVAGPLAGKLNGVQKNDNSAWLPASAEATKVIDLERTFRQQDAAPAIVVYERKSGITSADADKAAADARQFAALSNLAGTVQDPVKSTQDGATPQAIQTIVPVAVGTGGWAAMGATVDQMRAIVQAGKPDGLTVHVTGLAGLNADQNKAFKGTTGTLLYATLAVVMVILLLTYRSPVLWLLPIVSAGGALVAAQAVIYLFAKHAGLTVNAQSAAILTVLLFGAGTDYALLLIARYREELRRHEDHHEAMAVALLRAGPAIIASCATVAAAMLCMMVAEMGPTKGMGPVDAIGIVVGLLAMLTLLPALLVIFGRWIFWPARPAFGSTDPTGQGLWAWVGRTVAKRPRPIWIVTTLILGALAFTATGMKADGLSAADSFINKPESVTGAEVLARHFPAGGGSPVVVIGKAAAADQIRSAVAATEGIAETGQPRVKDGLAYVTATLRDAPDSPAADATVVRVRSSVHAIPDADAKVGGQTAVAHDIREATARDNMRIIPLVMLVVLIILGLLLRAIVAPLLLVATVVLSFGTALGASSMIFQHVFGWPAEDTGFPLFVFVFLVALGIDYNIFLMTRVREESLTLGTRRGTLAGLTVTGGVITSAGLVLAGTFASLGALPVVSFVEIGLAIALGVILDTIVVRSILVTALNLDFGRHIWWPSKLSKKLDVEELEPGKEQEPALQT